MTVHTDTRAGARDGAESGERAEAGEGAVTGEEVIIFFVSLRLFLRNGFLALEPIAYPTNNKYTLAMWHSSCCATFNAFKTATLAVAKTARGRERERMRD